ncbi:MAG: MotA/TolQ/ExbB proton channel family protein [Planctomycetaceae bacterium]|nr:MotA/TolQ/ExbB proton channel family protein [Planctomycetales bacterium]MCB9926495.1 MotA/TolQ/ExbB proton channel family protein [Planctomycetaceae bacterium]
MSARIIVVCPKCQNQMVASSDHIGREGRCQVCRSLVVIKPGAEQQASLTSLHPESEANKSSIHSRTWSSTDPSPLLAGVYGAAATAILYGGILLPLKSYPFTKLFLGASVIPYVTTLVTAWGLAILGLKYLSVKTQRSYAELELELIPLKIGVEITPDNVDQFLQHLDRSPIPQRFSILGRRIYGALDHFRSRNSVPEVQEYLTTQAEIDASQVDAGYTLLRAFIWAVPILGFIGTVVGISAAVGALEGSLGGDSSGSGTGDALMAGMEQVVAGLSTAFDTTLIALCMAIVLLFPTEALRKIEYRMLDRIQEFANESLLRRLTDEAAEDDLPEVVRDALEGAFQEHQRWLAEWQVRVSELGRVIGGDFAKIAVDVQGRLSESDASRIDRMRELNQVLDEIFERTGEASLILAQSNETMNSEMKKVLEVGQQLQQALLDNIQQCREFLAVRETLKIDDPHRTTEFRHPDHHSGNE